MNENKIGAWVEFFSEFFKVVILSLAIILPVRYFLIQPFYVKGASMEPNFFDHEYLVIDEISYRFREAQRGDTIVFRYPRDPHQFFIKRIIGLPGEKVDIRGGNVYIDEVLLDESEYLPKGTVTHIDASVSLSDDEFFVLGDNRDFSLDSRRFGPVKKDLTVGKTWIRGWPFGRISVISTPDYVAE